MLEKWEKNIIFTLLVLLIMATLVHLKIPLEHVFNILLK